MRIRWHAKKKEVGFNGFITEKYHSMGHSIIVDVMIWLSNGVNVKIEHKKWRINRRTDEGNSGALSVANEPVNFDWMLDFNWNISTQIQRNVLRHWLARPEHIAS